MHSPLVILRIGLFVVTCVVVLQYFGLYDLHLMSRHRYGARREILARLMQAFSVTVLALAALCFINPELTLGRGIEILAGPLALGFTLS
jgi:hypothetical protein